MTEPQQTTILFTAFEPSGDALAASAARGLAAIDPTIRQFGLGGGEMEVAGVEMLAQTTHEAAMGLGAVSEIMRIKRLVDLVDQLGPFGTLVMVGHDWEVSGLSQRSMHCLAENTLPRLKQHADSLGPARWVGL